MKLNITPFDEIERNKEYVLFKFKERGYPFVFLREKSQSRINSGNQYKFGVLSNKKKFYWFFIGRVVCKDRLKALETYTALLKYCDENGLGTPFAFKEF